MMWSYLLTAVAVNVPEACPDCMGLASPDAAPGMVLGSCAHPNAPTIGQMLREWQALTALAEYAGHQHGCFMGTYAYVGSGRVAVERPCTCGLDAARAALEAVRGD